MIKKVDIKRLPASHGVYLLKNKQNDVIYVGKAKNLALRVSYYSGKDMFFGKTADLIRESRNVDYLRTTSEVESLILEAELIKKLKPKYNVSLKDGKSYAYLVITKPNKATPDGHYPKVMIMRTTIDKGTNFGPFPDGYSLRTTLRSLRRIFPFRDCNTAKFLRFRRLNHGCLLADMKLCSAPCVVGKISPKDYRKYLYPLKEVFKGNSEKYLGNLRKKMIEASKNQEFERAQEFKIIIERLQAVTEKRIPAHSYLENPHLYNDLRSEELRDLEQFLNHYYPQLKLTDGGRRIESFDVSNLGSSNPVGVMVSFRDGEPERSFYRRYKIKTVGGVNDVKMIREIVTRRLRNKDIPQPNLILIDGGKSQVEAVSSLSQGNFIPCIGLAKRLERIVVNGEYQSVRRERPLLKLLMRIRDETHRFAINYQRSKRKIAVSSS